MRRRALLQAGPPAHLRRDPRVDSRPASRSTSVTVADELRRNGLLDEIGGPQTLLELQNATPAISNAARYAKIVQDTALLRRLIGVASEIAEIAYLEPDDVTKALDEAETKVFEVAEDRVTDSTRSLSDLLPLAMDQLQETFDRGDTITGTATGFHDLDELLSGLQPSTLNIVGARPAMGKTSLGLGIAAHVAQTARQAGAGVLAGDGPRRADPTHPRPARPRSTRSSCAPAGWRRPTGPRSAGRSTASTCPLFLDDNPRVTVMEIRAKARRMKARHGGLALIVIDYLQLMTGGTIAENRQLEVSEISRGLKILARELEVPIVALSQLSRNLETRADKRPMLADLRESGCLTADTCLVRADTNEQITLGELVESGADRRSGMVARRALPPGRGHRHGGVLEWRQGGVPASVLLRGAPSTRVQPSVPHRSTAGSRVEGLQVGSHLATSRRSPSGDGEGVRSMWDDGDLIPSEMLAAPARQGAGDHGVVDQRSCGCSGIPACRPALYDVRLLTRARAERIATATGDEWLLDLARSDVLWDRVIAIEPLGEMEVFDATVEPHHNFIANGVVAHNSLEQTADVVMFLYRDEVYNKESADKAMAKVIIAKPAPARPAPFDWCSAASTQVRQRGPQRLTIVCWSER